MDTIDWLRATGTLYIVGDAAPSGVGTPHFGQAGGIATGPLLDLVLQVRNEPPHRQHRFTLQLPNSERVVGPAIAALADRDDFPRL